MQEYEDVESSQIYIPDSDETQIVDNENETVSRCDILPHLAQTLSASCKKMRRMHTINSFYRIGGRTKVYSTAQKNMLSWKHMMEIGESVTECRRVLRSSVNRTIFLPCFNVHGKIPYYSKKEKQLS